MPVKQVDTVRMVHHWSKATSRRLLAARRGLEVYKTRLAKDMNLQITSSLEYRLTRYVCANMCKCPQANYSLPSLSTLRSKQLGI